MASRHFEIFLRALVLVFISLSFPAFAAAAKLCHLTRSFSHGWSVKLDVSNDGGTCSTELSYMASSRNRGRQ